MDALSEFFENQTKWMAKVSGISLFLGISFLVITLLTIENGKPFGFVIFAIGLWFFGITQIVNLYHPDEQGVSKVRKAAPFIRLLISLFHLLWLIGLAIITGFLIYKLING